MFIRIVLLVASLTTQESKRRASTDEMRLLIAEEEERKRRQKEEEEASFSSLMCSAVVFDVNGEAKPRFSSCQPLIHQLLELATTSTDSRSYRTNQARTDSFARQATHELTQFCDMAHLTERNTAGLYRLSQPVENGTIQLQK